MDNAEGILEATSREEAQFAAPKDGDSSEAALRRRLTLNERTAASDDSGTIEQSSIDSSGISDGGSTSEDAASVSPSKSFLMTFEDDGGQTQHCFEVTTNQRQSAVAASLSDFVEELVQR